MKKTAALVALAALIAWPIVGDAATKKKKARAHHPATHRTVVAPRPPAVVGDGRYHSPNPQWDVYRDNGEYAGSDPDPLVRLMLRRDDPNADPRADSRE
jgi:hypothetical protein